MSTHSFTLSGLPVIRGTGHQCALKFCELSLSQFYDMDINELKKVGADDPTIEAGRHVKTEGHYFKCPRCTGECKCSICRKKHGLQPLSIERAAQAAAEGGGEGSTATKKSKAANGQPKKSKGTKAKDAPVDKGKGKAKELVILMAKKSQKQPQGGSANAEPSGSKAMRQTSLPKPLRAPQPVAAPELQVIATSLKPENVWARVWIYETLVRFDFIRVPKATLSQLDKFDQWTHRQVQIILERILLALAGLSNINSGQPKGKTTSAVKAYREHGENLTRGEPWAAAQKLCELGGATIEDLPEVERVFEPEHGKERDDDTPVDRGPTLLGSRLTRTRRAAEVKALERVKLQSMADWQALNESESEDELHDDDEDHLDAASHSGDLSSVEDEDAEPRRGGGRGSTRKNKDRFLSPDGARRSSRQRGPVASGSGVAGTSRTSRIVSGMSSVADDISMRSSASPLSEPEEEVSVRPETPEAPPEPIPAPSMEQKVATLYALLELVMVLQEVGTELKEGANRLPEIEKAAQEDLKELKKEWEETREGIWKAAPSFASQPELFEKWKKDRDKTVRDFVLRILDTRVNAYKEMEANKIRSGPLGEDTDGRVYWQLTEFNEFMPANTAGRWAWCVLVYGEPMTKHAPPADAMPKDVANVSPLKAGARDVTEVEGSPEKTKQEDKDGDVEMKSESVDTAAVNGNGTAVEAGSSTAVQSNGAPPVTPSKEPATTEIVKTVTPQRSTSSSPLTPPPTNKDEGKVFMGTNHPPSIVEVIKFIQYRCSQLEYEEGVAQQRQDEGESGVGSRKAKKTLREMQEKRKKRVEGLCEKLESCRRYYLWHYAETEGIEDPATMF